MVTPGPPITAPPGPDLVARLQATRPQVRSFDAKGRLTYLSPKWNYSGTSLIKGRLPDTIRADVLDVLGRSLLFFYSNGQQVQVLSPKEGKFYRGVASPGNLAAFIPPAMTLQQALRLMVGDLPLSSGQPVRSEYEVKQGRYLFEWQYPGGSIKERLWVEAQEMQPVQDEWFGPGGRLHFSATFTNYGQITPGLPGQITVKTLEPKGELRLTYSDMTVNPPLKDTDLSVPKPAGVTEVPLK